MVVVPLRESVRVSRRPSGSQGVGGAADDGAIGLLQLFRWRVDRYYRFG